MTQKEICTKNDITKQIKNETYILKKSQPISKTVDISLKEIFSSQSKAVRTEIVNGCPQRAR